MELKVKNFDEFIQLQCKDIIESVSSLEKLLFFVFEVKKNTYDKKRQET